MYNKIIKIIGLSVSVLLLLGSVFLQYDALNNRLTKIETDVSWIKLTIQKDKLSWLGESQNTLSIKSKNLLNQEKKLLELKKRLNVPLKNKICTIF